MRILRHTVGKFDDMLSAGLSMDWTGGVAWATYEGAIAPDASVYGPGGAPDPFVRINHCATHTLFRSIFDQFLKVFMRVVGEANSALNDMTDELSRIMRRITRSISPFCSFWNMPARRAIG